MEVSWNIATDKNDECPDKYIFIISRQTTYDVGNLSDASNE